VNPERLKARILADGKLTLKEANQWYRYGKGVALTVDASKIDLDFINPDDYTEGAQGYSNVQTLFSSRDGRVYGNIGIRRVSGNQFQIHPDNYGFETHNGSGAQTWIRNQATKIGASYAGEGAPYDIYFRGYNTISPQYYYQQLYQRSNF
jgi:hypothetical protein